MEIVSNSEFGNYHFATVDEIFHDSDNTGVASAAPPASPSPSLSPSPFSASAFPASPASPGSAGPESALRALRCPISLELPVYPVLASDGKIYDSKSLCEWMRVKNTSPFDRKLLTSTPQPVEVLRDVIEGLAPSIKPNSDIFAEVTDWRAKIAQMEKLASLWHCSQNPKLQGCGSSLCNVALHIFLSCSERGDVVDTTYLERKIPVLRRIPTSYAYAAKGARMAPSPLTFGVLAFLLAKRGELVASMFYAKKAAEENDCYGLLTLAYLVSSSLVWAGFGELPGFSGKHPSLVDDAIRAAKCQGEHGSTFLERLDHGSFGDFDVRRGEGGEDGEEGEGGEDGEGGEGGEWGDAGGAEYVEADAPLAPIVRRRRREGGLVTPLPMRWRQLGVRQLRDANRRSLASLARSGAPLLHRQDANWWSMEEDDEDGDEGL